MIREPHPSLPWFTLSISLLSICITLGNWYGWVWWVVLSPLSLLAAIAGVLAIFYNRPNKNDSNRKEAVYEPSEEQS